MAVTFPTSPTNGQQVTADDKVYTYSAAEGVWNITANTADATSVVALREEVIATEGQTSFAVTYNPDYPVAVTVNGLEYLSSDFTATSGTAVVMNEALAAGDEVVIKYSQIETAGVDLSAITESIVPDTDVAYDLGSSDKKFRDLYLSGNSIIIGDTTISASGGELQVAATGETPAPVGGGVSGYATTAEMPLVDNALGDTAFVAENNRLYVWNGSGWYSVGLINTAPSITTGGAGSYELAIDGTPTVITLDAEDPEGLPITWSYTVTSGSLGNTATVSQADNVFTITPSTDEIDEGTFELTFSASDGVNIATDVNAFTLSFITYTILRKHKDYDNTSNYSGGGSGTTNATDTVTLQGYTTTLYSLEATQDSWWWGTGAIDLSGPDGFTWEFWIKSSGTSVGGASYVQVFNDGYNNSNIHTFKYGSQYWYFADGSKSPATLNTPIVPDSSNFYHVVLQGSPSDNIVHFWKNGAYVGNIDGTWLWTNNQLTWSNLTFNGLQGTGESMRSGSKIGGLKMISGLKYTPNTTLVGSEVMRVG